MPVRPHTKMPIPKISKLADELFLRPIVISMNSLVLTSLMSYVMSGTFDWRPITICVMSDILAIGSDHLKDQESEFLSAHHNADGENNIASWFTYARTFLTASAVLLALALFLCPVSTLLTTAVVVAPALLWTTPIDFNKFEFVLKRLLGKSGRAERPSTSMPVLVIKRIPGMKAIFNGLIRGCGLYAIVFSALSGSGSLTDALPSPWTATQVIVWSTVNRTCHAILTDVRDFEDDLKAGVSTIPVLLGSFRKTKVMLTACHILVMLAFIENIYITGSCLYATALVWMLGKDSPKKAFLLSSHSQSLFIIWYLLKSYT
ncbi:hypothetical protein DFH29DRAFT_564828 [Suillus ampliporus]|nr:hypothetical protein DFH29DRAFT_564828 [Suillus ampliporus]